MTVFLVLDCPFLAAGFRFLVVFVGMLLLATGFGLGRFGLILEVDGVAAVDVVVFDVVVELLLLGNGAFLTFPYILEWMPEPFRSRDF